MTATRRPPLLLVLGMVLLAVTAAAAPAGAARAPPRPAGPQPLARRRLSSPVGFTTLGYALPRLGYTAANVAAEERFASQAIRDGSTFGGVPPGAAIATSTTQIRRGDEKVVPLGRR